MNHNTASLAGYAMYPHAGPVNAGIWPGLATGTADRARQGVAIDRPVSNSSSGIFAAPPTIPGALS